MIHKVYEPYIRARLGTSYPGLPLTPYTSHPTTYTLHSTPCTLHPAHFTLRPTPRTLHPKPQPSNQPRAALDGVRRVLPVPPLAGHGARQPRRHRLRHARAARWRAPGGKVRRQNPSTLNPTPYTLNLKPQTLHPKP